MLHSPSSSIAILGFGLEGQSTLRYLTAQGVEPSRISILARDFTPEQRVLTNGFTHIDGPGYLEMIHTFDVVFKTPGLTFKMIDEQRSKPLHNRERLKFTSQTQAFLEWYEGVLIMVTGTKGKSTTVTVMEALFKQLGLTTILLGNIGAPPFDIINPSNQPEIVIYEISSFMLDQIRDVQYRCDIGVVTSLTPTHIAEHGSIEEYYQAKLSLARHSDTLLISAQAIEELKRTEFMPVNDDNHCMFGTAGVYTRSPETNYFMMNGKVVASSERMLIEGDHNRLNMCSVLGAMDLLSDRIPPASSSPDMIYRTFEQVLETTTGLPHRLQHIGTTGAIKRYDDAIATTPLATKAALDTFTSDCKALLYGGIEDHYNHMVIAEAIIAYNIQILVLFPDSGRTLLELLMRTPEHLPRHVFMTRSMSAGVAFINDHLDSDDPGVVLLSCGSPSFSNRKSYKEKGNEFISAVDLLMTNKK